MHVGEFLKLIAARRKWLFDHFVGDGEQVWRDVDAERSRRLQVDDELKFGRLGTGRSAGFAPLRMRPV